MSDPTNKDPNAQQQFDLATELRELGQQLEHAVRSTLESERAQAVRRDIASGLREIGTQLQHAVESIKDDPRVQRLAERGQQAVQQAQETQAAKDFQEALARGIAQLNEQLATFISRTQTSTPPVTGTQSVPIEHDTPATGETTRLDPDKQG